MLKDREENEINVLAVPNGHMLVLGKSGMGKTYFLCRELERHYEAGERCLIMDFSGSYTREELEKNEFRYIENITEINPQVRKELFFYRLEGVEKILTDALICALKISSYYQKKLLLEAVKKVIDTGENLSIPRLVAQIEKFLLQKEAKEEKDNLLHLLTRFGTFGDIDNLEITLATSKDSEQRIVILQLSDFPDLQKMFLMSFFSELLWAEIRRRKSRADVFVFDEFQNLELKPGFAISSILREGRKMGVAALLSSQFMAYDDKAIKQMLMQCGNMIFFRPTEEGLRNVSQWIAELDASKWRNILGTLDVGEVVLKGNYCIGKNTRKCTKPICCKVKKEETKNVVDG